MKTVVAAIQMPAEMLAIDDNLERADTLLREAHLGEARLAVLPEMCVTGYGVLPDYAKVAETADGRAVSHFRARSMRWKIATAFGFVERAGKHLYDSLALCLPDGNVHIYRKRNLVFWERFRFRPGKATGVVNTPFGRVGMAICADMIYSKIWDGYRNHIDLAVVAAAWPDFADRNTGRKHWLMGKIGPMSAQIPGLVARDLAIPVVFANQCGPTHTTIPLLGMWVAERLPDRFAGSSSVSDGLHGPSVLAGGDEEIVLTTVTLHPSRGPKSCHIMSPSADAIESPSESVPC